VLGGTDFAVRFSGTHHFTEEDFRSATFVLAGTDGNDTIAGTEGDDTIFGFGGDDTLLGLGGDDEIDGGAGNDVIDGGAGFNNLRGGDGNDVLTLQESDFGGNAEGGAGDDLLIGSDAPFSFSFLSGGEGNDTLRAGDGGASLVDFDGGDDRLEGGAGDDQFLGGAGTDVFVFGAVWTTPGSGFTDVIEDLEDGVEKIDLSTSGLTFADLTIEDIGQFSAVITSSAGRIEVSGFGEFGNGGRITEDDFLFA
jgi:Ca2+-binding RTX toxin-like protein